MTSTLGPAAYKMGANATVAVRAAAALIDQTARSGGQWCSHPDCTAKPDGTGMCGDHLAEFMAMVLRGTPPDVRARLVLHQRGYVIRHAGVRITWHDLRPKRRPTPVDMMVLLAAIAMVNGHVLACNAENHESRPGHADGVTFGPTWWNIPADTWHEKWALDA